MIEPGHSSGRSDLRTGRDFLQRALAWFYDRLGARVLIACLVANVAFAAVASVVFAGWADRYMHLGGGDFRLLVGLGVPLLLLAAAAYVWSLWGRLRPVLSWSGERRSSERAASAWTAAVELPVVLARRGAYVIPCLTALVSLLFLVISDSSAAAGGALWVLSWVAGASILIVLVFSVELVLRPLLADVASFLPAEFEPEAHGWRVRTKALAPFPFITVYSVLTVGGFVDLVAHGPLRLALALGIATATVAVASLIFWSATHVLLDPIDDLLAATRRVSDGDVTTSVAVVSADELGKLSHGFNQMLAGLRRHEEDAAAAEEERRRVERDIHDGAQQRLAAISMWVDGLGNRIADGEHEAAIAMARRISDELHEAIEELRRLSRGMPPAVLAMRGLDPALKELTERTPGATLRGSVGEAIPPNVAVATYYAVAEGLANAIRHSGAAVIEVAVDRRNGNLCCEIHDNGRGGASLEAGSGLRGLTARLNAQGGCLAIESPPGVGTALSIEVPLDHARPGGPR